MANYDLLNQEKAKNEGIELANKHLDMVREALKEVKPLEVVKKVSDLTVTELQDLVLWCLGNHEKIKAEKAQAEWERLQKEKG